MLIGRAATIGIAARKLILAGIGAMRGGLGWKVVVRMPKKAVVVGSLIFIRVVNVDIDYMVRQISHKSTPAKVATPQKMDTSSVDKIILIVVMGYEKSGSCMVNRLMIGIDVAEISPSVFVDGFTSRKERSFPIDYAIYIGEVFFLSIIGLGGEPGDDASMFHPLGIECSVERLDGLLKASIGSVEAKI